MKDIAHNETDRQLAEIEKKIKEIYRQAYEETQEKLIDYLQEFEREDAKKKKLLESGKISKKSYQKWRMEKMIEGERWRNLSNSLAEDFTHANQIAMNIVNGYTSDAYANNYNYTAYQIEHDGLVDTSFTLYDRQTVERLIRENPDLLPEPSIDIPKDLRWNRQKIQSVVTQGILQGESIPKIAARMQSVTDMNHSAAVRNARTAMTGAQNAGRVDGYKRAENMGIKLKQKWMATLDGRTRHEHRQMDGETVAIGEIFSNGCRFPGDPQGRPEEIYNCFVGDTEIASDSEIIRSYKHVYYGDLINIKTSGGVDFTCTPNHPILSDSGWISAARLNKGDNLVVASVGNIHMSRRNPNIDHVHTRIDAFHEFFNEIFGHRACNLGVNFHGDIPATDVEIVTKEGLLRICLNSALFKRFYKFMFKSANESFTGNSAFMKHFRCICKAAFSFVRCMDKPFTFLNRRLLHSDKHSLRPISRSDSCVSQYTINDLTTKSEAVSEALTRFPGQISVDKVVDVKIIPSRSSGIHVYNLQTNNGYYFVNSSIAQNAQKCNGNFAIVHNCRCTLIAELEGLETDFATMHRYSKLGNMSYEDWKKIKK